MNQRLCPNCGAYHIREVATRYIDRATSRPLSSKEARRAPARVVRSYRCDACMTPFDWMEGTDWPKVRHEPDTVRRHEDWLRTEAERQQAFDESMRALAFYDQQRRRRERE